MSLFKMKQERDEILAKLGKIEAQIEKEEAQRAAMTPEARLAVDLHDATCTWNHTDGCGWYYEISKGAHNWDGSSHSRYLASANKLIHKCGDLGRAEEALDKYRLVKSL